MSAGYVYILDMLLGETWKAYDVSYTYRAWASALLVLQWWAMRRPKVAGRVTGTDSRAFFFIWLLISNLWTVRFGNLSGRNTFKAAMMRVSGLLNQSLYAVALTVCMFMLCGCNDLGTKECPRCQTFKSGMSRNLSGQKPIVNVYLENSGSMFGYVNGLTEFEESVYSYLSDICLSGIDSLNLYYINNESFHSKVTLDIVLASKILLRSCLPIIL